MATVAEVETVLTGLLSRLGQLDPGTRSMLPSRRTIQARCPDLDLVHHAEWRNGRLTVQDDPPSRRPDIRITVHSDDLMAIHRGELSLSRAYTANKIRIDAPMTDLLRLRAVL